MNVPRFLQGLALTLATSCTFSVNPNQGHFSCRTDADCGGGYQCVPQLNFGGEGLCFPTGQCTGSPSCCDFANAGKDLLVDNANCGACGHVCHAGTSCDGGACQETNCLDGIDNDGNGLTDCQDPSCTGRTCSVTDAGFVCGLAWVPLDSGIAPDGGGDAGLLDAGYVPIPACVPPDAG